MLLSSTQTTSAAAGAQDKLLGLWGAHAAALVSGYTPIVLCTVPQQLQPAPAPLPHPLVSLAAPTLPAECMSLLLPNPN